MCAVPDTDTQPAAACQALIPLFCPALSMLCAEADEGSDGSGHRLLVFAQMKGMLDLVERDVLLPSGVSFLRLDGSMEPNSRCATVKALPNWGAGCYQVPGPEI